MPSFEQFWSENILTIERVKSVTSKSLSSLSFYKAYLKTDYICSAKAKISKVIPYLQADFDKRIK